MDEIKEQDPDDDDDDILELESKEDGVLFYQNRSGFPLDDKTWDRMWEHASKIHPNGSKIVLPLKNKTKFDEIPVPQPPMMFPLNTPIVDRLDAIQKYMNELQYNHTGTQFFEIRKYRPLSGHMECAKEMVREALPIKCLEATILGIYLSNGMPGLDRYMISFNSSFMGQTYRHVVLGVHYCSLYGALGMSRRSDLMYKKLKYKNLSYLIKDYIGAYAKYCHKLKKVKIGLPIPHDPHSYEQINWKTLTVNINKSNLQESYKELDRFAREMRTQAAQLNKLESVYAAHSSASKGLKSNASSEVGNQKSKKLSNSKLNKMEKKRRKSSTKLTTDKSAKEERLNSSEDKPERVMSEPYDNQTSEDKSALAVSKPDDNYSPSDSLSKQSNIKPLQDTNYHVKI